MSEEIRKTFLMWLSEQAYRTDDTGKFARSMIEADNVPTSSKLLDWYKFIKENNKMDLINVFTAVWGEYIDDKKRG